MPLGFEERGVVERHVENVLSPHQHCDGAVAEGRDNGNLDRVGCVGDTNDRHAAILRPACGVIVNLGHESFNSYIRRRNAMKAPSAFLLAVLLTSGSLAAAD